MLCRAPHLVAMHNKTRSQRDMSHAVLFATGCKCSTPFPLKTGKPLSGSGGTIVGWKLIDGSKRAMELNRLCHTGGKPGLL